MRSQATQPVGLADAIENLREEITAATERGRDQRLRFNVGQVELELAVEIEREAGADGKVSFKVLGAGAEVGGDGSLSRTTAHRMKITLKPLEDGQQIQVIDEDSRRPD
jgi:hypothetical protein